MSNNQDQNSGGEESPNDRTANEKAATEDRRKKNDKPEKRGEKDDTVLGEINDE